MNDRPIRKIHDLLVLVEECAAFDESFRGLEEAAEILTPYGIAFCYPGDVLEPEMEEAREAIGLARQFINLAKRNVE